MHRLFRGLKRCFVEGDVMLTVGYFVVITRLQTCSGAQYLDDREIRSKPEPVLERIDQQYFNEYTFRHKMVGLFLLQQEMYT